MSTSTTTDRLCSRDGCERKATARGFCNPHYNTWRYRQVRDGAIVVKACSIEDCEKPQFARGWCTTHYSRWKNHGDPLTYLRHDHSAGGSGNWSPTYISWTGMNKRCRNPNDAKYPEYGERDITICERWESFENFLEDMGERPDGTTIDRIDNDGNYEPGNCRWATPVEQAANRRPRRWAKRPKVEVGHG